MTAEILAVPPQPGAAARANRIVNIVLLALVIVPSVRWQRAPVTAH